MDIQEKIIWAAGFFDGEGYAGIQKRARVNNQYGYYVRIDVSQLLKEPLEILLNLFGGYIVSVNRTPNHDRRRSYQWGTQSEKAYKALKAMYPYLVVKQEEARICIEYYEGYIEYKTRYAMLNYERPHPDSEENKRRERLYQELREIRQQRKES